MKGIKKFGLYCIMFGLIGLGCKFCFDFYISMSFKLAIVFCVLEGTNFITFTSAVNNFKSKKYIYSLIFMSIFVFSILSSIVSISGNYYNITGEAEKKQEKKVENEKYKSLETKIKEDINLAGIKKEELKKIEEMEQQELKTTNQNFTNTLTSIRSNYLKLKEAKNNEIEKVELIIQNDKNILAGTNKLEIIKKNSFNGNNAFFTEIAKALKVKESNFVLIFSILSALFFNLIIICIKITIENMTEDKVQIAENKESAKVQIIESANKKSAESAKSAKVQIIESAKSAKVQNKKSAKSAKSATIEKLETIENAILEDYQGSAKVQIEENKKVQKVQSAKVQSSKKVQSASLEKVQKVQSAKNVKVQNEIYQYYLFRKSENTIIKDKEIIFEIIEKFGISERTFKTIKSKYKS